MLCSNFTKKHSEILELDIPVEDQTKRTWAVVELEP